ncbi:MAG: universal stress protein [Nitrospirota bacterium]
MNSLAPLVLHGYNPIMYRNILSAVNEYTNSEIAARYAIALAKSCQAKLSLVFVAEDRFDRELFRRVESSLERLFIEAKEQDIEVESLTERGKPYEKISSIVNKNKVDLSFFSTRREDMEKRFFAKTLSRELMIKLPSSVAMVRVTHMGRGYPKRILVPLRSHMTRLEERAFFAAKLAQAFNSTVTLFHLHRPIVSFFHGELYLKPAEREEYIPKDIEKFTELLEKYGVSHEKKTGYGAVSRSITIEAAHKRNDLIVMGASERSLLKSIIRESPVEKVLRETPCNLIIFRPKR